MPPTTGHDPIGTVQQAIVSLLRSIEPLFIGLGSNPFDPSLEPAAERTR